VEKQFFKKLCNYSSKLEDSKSSVVMLVIGQGLLEVTYKIRC